MSPASQRAFYTRLAIVEDWEAARLEGKQAGRRPPDIDREFLAELERNGTRVSRSTLFNWRRAYRMDGLQGLVDQRPSRQRQAPDRRFLERVRQLYLQPGKLRSIEVCHFAASEEAPARGWRPCTLRQTKRYVRSEILPRLTAERGW